LGAEEKAALGRRAKAGETSKWDGVVPAGHQPRSKGAGCADRVGHPLQDAFEGSCRAVVHHPAVPRVVGNLEERRKSP